MCNKRIKTERDRDMEEIHRCNAKEQLSYEGQEAVLITNSIEVNTQWIDGGDYWCGYSDYPH